MNKIQPVRTDRNHSGIPGATVAFAATLTATSNEYLAPHLPARGLVQIGERSIFGDCIRVQFAREIEPGIWSAFVACPDAEFTFTSKV